MKFSRIITWYGEHVILAPVCFLLTLSLLGVFLHARAATSYDVANESQMFLDTTITNTQTTGIVLASPQWNSVNYTFTTKTGGILRLRQGFKREDILYTSATVNATTLKITLVGVTRNICPNVFFFFVTCGNGQSFSKGATVELIQDARLFNLKANIDRVNTFTGSGMITGTNTDQAVFRPNSVTTTQRNAFTNVGNGDIIFNSTIGLNQYYAGGSWYSFGSGALAVNASQTVRGIVQIAVSSDLSGAVTVGSTTAQPIAGMDLVIRRSSGAINNRNKIAATNNTGYLSGSLLGSVFGSGKYLHAINGTTRWDIINSSTSLTNSGNLVVNSFQTGSLVNFQKANTSYFQIKGAMDNGHIVTGGTSIGTPNANCGSSPSLAAGSNDIAGIVTLGGGTVKVCSVAFNKNYTRAPACLLTSNNNSTLTAIQTTNTGFVISSASVSIAGNIINYICFGF